MISNNKMYSRKHNPILMHILIYGLHSSMIYSRTLAVKTRHEKSRRTLLYPFMQSIRTELYSILTTLTTNTKCSMKRGRYCRNTCTYSKAMLCQKFGLRQPEVPKPRSEGAKLTHTENLTRNIKNNYGGTICLAKLHISVF